MSKARPWMLESISFEVRYAFGHTYLDRCGQTLVDIERSGQGWVPGDATPVQGTLTHPTSGLTANFNTTTFVISATRGEDNDIDFEVFARHATLLWTIVSANLGVTVLYRVGLRPQWFHAVESYARGVEVQHRMPMHVRVPPEISGPFEAETSVLVVASDAGRYRFAIDTITRTRARAPFMASDPKVLPKHQRELRLKILEEEARYNRNPLYAIRFDADASIPDQNEIVPSTFAERQMSIIETQFRPILTGIT